MDQGILVADIHGMNVYQAKTCLNSLIKRASGATYRIRVIHGYHSGTALKDMIRAEYGGNHAKVKRIEVGLNPGETDLVLKEF